uniref:Latent transforming growth factor beta binding protein 4 n=1 Tax=Chelonoidis abingdonii TaxID=106734 RepID=A0A8C0JBD1_CHEAB
MEQHCQACAPSPTCTHSLHATVCLTRSITPTCTHSSHAHGTVRLTHSITHTHHTLVSPLDENQAVCWQAVGPDLVCSRPRLDRQVTYTECCCLYGEAWGMDCALCPARDSDDFEALCNVLRPPSYGPARPGLGLPYEYGPEFVPSYGLPYGPELFAGSAARGPQPGLRPDYDPYALGGYAGRRDSLYGPSTYEAGDFEDLAYVDARPEEPPAPYQRPDPPRTYRPRSPPDPEPGVGGPERLPEEWAVCSACPTGFTCRCRPGLPVWTLLPTCCLDINECAEAEGPPTLCLNGRCINMDGSYRCLCSRGYILSQPPNSCVPARPRA